MKTIKIVFEAVAVVLFFIILSPVILLFLIFGGILYVIEILSGNKANPKLTESLMKTDDSSEKIAQMYLDKIKDLLPDVKIDISTDKSSHFDSYDIESKQAKANIYWDEYMVGIDIIGADTGYWHIAEEENIDIFFWFMIGALRNGIKYHRPALRLKQAWIYSDENSAWVVVPKKYHGYGYTKFRGKFPK